VTLALGFRKHMPVNSSPGPLLMLDIGTEMLWQSGLEAAVVKKLVQPN
jgi:hypothetical protein